MKVLSSTSLLDGDETLKVIKVRKCDVDYHRLKSHPSYNEFCAIYGYYLYKIQSDNETRTFPGFVRSIKAIWERNNGRHVLSVGSANDFLYYIEIINKYAAYIADNNYAAKYRMACFSFFSRFPVGKTYDANVINNKLFSESSFSEVELANRTHFYRLVEFYHADIAENLPKEIELYHPLPEELRFKISHGISALYMSPEELSQERTLYYGRV